MNQKEQRRGTPLACTGERGVVCFGEEVFDPETDPPDHWTTKERDSFTWTNVRVFALDNGGYTIGIGKLGLRGLPNHVDHYSVFEDLKNVEEVEKTLTRELDQEDHWLADQIKEDLIEREHSMKKK